jgi:hypothetical protein
MMKSSMRWIFALAVLAMIASSTNALACPVCNSETGFAVRAGIFDENFWLRMLSIAAPFPFLAAIIAAIQFGGARHRPVVPARDRATYE